MSPSEPQPPTLSYPDGQVTVSADGTRTAGDLATAFAPTAGFAPQLAPDSIPGYQLGELIGEGGMAVVFLGRDAALGHLVAIKLIRSTGIKDRVRFLAEAQALAAVHHRNVVRVVTFGNAGEFPYLVMEYLPGGTLAAKLRDGGQRPIRDAVELVAKVARAVQAVHDEQIIHRDLKPGNILFDANGEPKVCDFGLAKRGVGSDLTATHAVIGTPAYMAPEQARGETKFVGPSADVYALGVILYECLTGARPFRATEALPLLKLVVDGDFPHPRRVRPDIPKDLERVTLAAMALDPADRYPTAGKLADDLERFLAGQSVSVRSPGVVERAAKWAKRKPTETLSLALAAAVVVLLAIGVSLTLLWQQADGARAEAISARNAAEKAKGETEQARAELAEERDWLAVIDYGRSMEMAHQAWRENDLSAARSISIATDATYRNWEWNYVRRLTNFERRTFTGHTEPVVGVAYDGKGERFATASWDHTVRIWDAVSGKTLLTFDKHKSRVWSVRFHPTKPLVLSVEEGAGAILWNAETGEIVHTFPKHEFGTRSAAFNKDGSRVVTVGYDKTATVYNSATFAPVCQFSGAEKTLLAAEFTTDSSAVISAGENGFVRVWDAVNGKELRSEKIHAGTIWSLAVSPVGNRFVTCSEDGPAAIWDSVTLKKVANLEGNSTNCWQVAYSPDGTRIAGAGMSSVVMVWDAASGEELRRFKGHTEQAWALAFHPKGNTLLSGSSDRTVREWPADREQEYRQLPRHPDQVRCMAIAPNGKSVITGCEELNHPRPVNRFRVFDADTLLETHTLPAHPDRVVGLAYSGDGTLLATLSDTALHLWNPADWSAPPKVIPTPHAAFTSVAVDRHGTRIVTGDSTGLVTFWTPLGTFEKMIFAGDSRVSVALSPDGSTLVTADANGYTAFWDTATKEKKRSFTERAVRFTFASVDPTGEWALTPGKDRTVRVTNIANGELRGRMFGHSGEITGSSYSPDGQRVLTTSEDGSSKLWVASRRVAVLTLRGHSGLVFAGAFHPDGMRIVTASADRRTIVWDARP